jgi:diguanylate cyclase (GGDEF)-like protein
MERLLEELRALRFEDEHGASFHASFSAGISSLPSDGTTLQELVRAADRRLYGAKAAGRSRVRSQD